MKYSAFTSNSLVCHRKSFYLLSERMRRRIADELSMAIDRENEDCYEVLSQLDTNLVITGLKTFDDSFFTPAEMRICRMVSDWLDGDISERILTLFNHDTDYSVIFLAR